MRCLEYFITPNIFYKMKQYEIYFTFFSFYYIAKTKNLLFAIVILFIYFFIREYVNPHRIKPRLRG